MCIVHNVGASCHQELMFGPSPDWSWLERVGSGDKPWCFFEDVQHIVLWEPAARANTS